MSFILSYIKYQFKTFCIKYICNVTEEEAFEVWFVTNDKFLESRTLPMYEEFLSEKRSFSEIKRFLDILPAVGNDELFNRRVQDLFKVCGNDFATSEVLNALSEVIGVERITNCYIRDNQNAACLLTTGRWLFFNINANLKTFIDINNLERIILSITKRNVFSEKVDKGINVITVKNIAERDALILAYDTVVLVVDASDDLPVGCESVTYAYNSTLTSWSKITN